MGYRKRPSDAGRWYHCPGSLAFTKDFPQSEGSYFANEGTLAHYVREQCLLWGQDAYEYIGYKMVIDGETHEFTEDFADAIQPGIDEINQYEGTLFVEKYVNTTEWVGLDEQDKPQGGTIDALVVGKKLTVISDLKFGRGVPVSAVENYQQIIYLLGCYKGFISNMAPECRKFLIIIDQPRNSAPDAGGYWQLTLDELLKYGEKIKERAKQVDSTDALRIPGDKQCRWCQGASLEGRPGGCPDFVKKVLDDLELDFDDLDEIDSKELPVVNELTPERLIKLSERRKDITSFLEYAHARALEHLILHGPTAGKKAVQGRKSPLKWRDKGIAEQFLVEKLSDKEAFKKVLLTPSQAKSKLGKTYEFPDGIAFREEGKPIIVDEKDAREEISSVDDFPEETET